MKIEIDFGSGPGRPLFRKWVLFLVPLFLAAWALWLWIDPILATLSPFALAFVFAYLINPAVDAIAGEHRRRFKINRALSIFILLFLLLGVLMGFLGYVIPNAVHEGATFATHFRHKIFPVLKKEIQPRLDQWFARRSVVSNERFEEWDEEGTGPTGWEVASDRAEVRRLSPETGGAVVSPRSAGWVLRQEVTGLIGEETYTLEVKTRRSPKPEPPQPEPVKKPSIKDLLLGTGGDDWTISMQGEGKVEGELEGELFSAPVTVEESLKEGIVIPPGVTRGSLLLAAPSPAQATSELEVYEIRLTGAPALPIFDLDQWARWYSQYKDLFTLSSIGRVMTYGVRGAGVVAEGAGGVWTWLSKTLGGVVSFAVYLVLLVVILFYMLLDFTAFKKSCVELLPDPYEDRFAAIMLEIDKSLGGFIRGQATICLIVGLLVMTFMALLGVPFAILIGLGAGMFNFIPYLGPTMGMAPAITLTLLGFVEPGADLQWVSIKLCLVVGSFMLVQMIDGLFLSPKILSESVDVPPLVVMGALMLGGSIAGVTGMVLAIPGYCVLRVLASEYQKEWAKTQSD